MPVVRSFFPSTHGFHFENSWPVGTPDYVVDVPIVGKVSIGDASNGLCGGMVFSAGDLYLAGLRLPPDTTPPGGGSPLFEFIASRLLASFNVPTGVLTYYHWANTPDHDTGVPPAIRSGLAHLTIRDEIPLILGSIGAGRPAGLGLVTVRSLNPGDLRHCHQVLAYGYSWSGAELTLRVYDPNQPDRDSITIQLDTSHPAHTTEIRSNVDCDPIRGFFYTTYRFADPAAVGGRPWKQAEVTAILSLLV